MGWCRVCSTSRYEKAYCWWYIICLWVHMLQVQQNKIEYKAFYWGQSSQCKRVPTIQWIWIFMEAQVYIIKQNILFQNNQSAVKMENNEKTFCTSNSRHINIWYFLVKEWIDKSNMPIAYCSTDHMLAGFYTKALQGYLSVRFHKVIMGWKHIDTLQMVQPSTKEFVGYLDDINSIKKGKKK